MNQFAEIFNAAGLFLSGLAALIVVSVLVKVLSRGADHVRNSRERGVNLVSYTTASVPRSKNDTSIALMEGIELMADGEELVVARSTRTIAGEID